MNKNGIRNRVLAKEGLIDVHTHVGADAVKYRLGEYPYAQSAEDLMIRMDRWKVDFACCFPRSYTAWFDFDAYLHGRMVGKPSPECPAPYVAENENLCREIYEAYPDCAGRLLPFMFFDPAREQAGQADALGRIAQQFPVFGLKTATSYLQSHITDLLDAGAVLLNVAADWDLPLLIHSAVMPGDPWADVWAILKVVRARPDVRFCIAHTCRFDQAALEEADALPNCFVDFSAFNIHGQLAVQNHPAVAPEGKRFPADYRDHAAVMQAIAEAYPSTLVWGTDSPAYCFMSRFVDDQGRIHSMKLQCGTDTEIQEFRKLPETMRRRIGYENTVRYLFGVDGAGNPAAGDPPC